MKDKEKNSKKSLTVQIYEEWFSNISKSKLFSDGEIFQLKKMANSGDLKNIKKLKKFITQESGDG